ncbi:DNA topoisomerase [Catenaria anguillulae PL171]|uniref:DNA topoisomerase 2 n=1 Tax=Catenaria anguillulae PL171 TaxID=765915 RepID=A0A1Y2I096_9FUNG|nr:DNA topoisomerase [Catenaria anguillulae PL171]
MDLDTPDSENYDPSPTGSVKGGKSIEETYQKVSQLEHVLLRPDTYVGSVHAEKADMWIVNEAGELERKTITFVPALYKIFDEIIVNAADNKVRDSRMNLLEVTIDPDANEISIKNNGQGIPIEIHKTEKVHVPELIFGHLLTSSNYNDDDKKVVGGRNGYGAKLCNIFSTRFVIETADTKKKYTQVFRNNMKDKEEPRIVAFPGSKPSPKNQWTKITFRPDLEKFKMDRLDEDTVGLLKRRVYDMAGCLPGVNVTLNGEKVDIKDFKAYVGMYVKDPSVKIVYEKHDRWEVAMVPSEDEFQQVSYVNSICTSRGGTHVEHVAGQVVTKVVDSVKKKIKDATIRPAQVKNHLWVFVNCQIENPTFDSQTKETLTLRHTAFGSKCSLSDKFIKAIMSSGVVERCMTAVKAKQDAQLKKTDGAKRSRLVGINKLEDATLAGTRDAKKCTLILTEGDSAKALAVAGLAVVGREFYGVYPLRGKLLNVRDAASKSVLENKEISELKQIIGLQQGKKYTDTTSLRYGHIMIMTDQDHDGSHIKGLIINLLDHYWPSLLEIPGFLCEFITPIIKCTPKGGSAAAAARKGSKVMSFFTLEEYKQWKDTHDSRKYTIKYYKGLGTSTSAEAKEYFSNLPVHKKPFDPCQPNERKLIDMAFSKKKSDERKDWLIKFEPGTYMDHARDSIPIDDFINKELIQFSVMDNHRSIPSVVDGLKPGQRKVLFACFRRNLKDEIKVAQLSGYVAEHSAYHHGEASLGMTIVNLAQDYVGSNNIPLLEPRGQFGTRLAGGADAASARYIFTTMSPITRKIFHPADDGLLEPLDDDGKKVEPEWYIPILPMVLVNGAQGIGTGWSTSIPCYSPLDIVANVRRMIRGEACEEMSPFYRGFTGTIEKMPGDKYRIAGSMIRKNPETVWITELPVGVWTSTFKTLLDGFAAVDKATPLVYDYSEHHTENTVEFHITLTTAGAKLSDAEIEKTFKLVTTMSTTNMVCFDPSGRIKKYSSPEQIVHEHYVLRLGYYEKRKNRLVDVLTRELTMLQNKTRFIREVVDRSLIIERKRKSELVAELRRRGYMPESKLRDSSSSVAAAAESADNNDSDEDDAAGDFNYLLSMPLYSLTDERIRQLESQTFAKEKELERVKATTPEEMWEADLEAFEQEYLAYLEFKAEADAHLPAIAGGKGGKKRKAKAASNAWLDDDDGSDAEYSAPKRAKPAPKKKTPAAISEKPAKPRQRPRQPRSARSSRRRLSN